MHQRLKQASSLSCRYQAIAMGLYAGDPAVRKLVRKPIGADMPLTRALGHSRQ